ncbi:peptidoglycan DD-metalloendopeptidase family protein [Streptomyces sp. NPDC058657]|uniref:peptidoglycan DD-metalloendopeptidase family protein n=1 Tax=unclassified Streptomyces TaxID=2593676 RepID=UPI003668465D
MAAAATEVAVGYVSIVPSARGYAAELQQQIARPTAQVGEQVGQQAGQATSRGMLSSLGSGLKAGLGLVAAAGGVLFAAGFSEAVAQEQSGAKLAAQLGLNTKDAAKYGKIAGDVYATGYGQSVDEVNTALAQLTQNGIIAAKAPKKDVEALTKSALGLAEAFGTDVGAAARAAGQLVKTGLARNSREAFDLITRGFQTGADKSEDFLDTLNEYGVQFKALGLTGSQSIGLLTQGLKAGARDGDLVADALKEFTIRATDGSKASAEGFKALGLSGEKMTAIFAKGGPGAAKGLDLVLDRLRAIPDPATRSQTAVTLFGTQAEDLNKALFALDPSKAVGAIGAVGGAADRMGKTLHGTSTMSIEVFRRAFMQGLVRVITTYVLPAVVAVGTFLNTYVLPVVQTVGAAVLSVLVPAITAVAGAFMAGARWVREYGAWLLPLAVAVAGLTITLNASAIATAAVTAVFSLYRGVLIAAAAVTRGYAIAQGLLNAVMNANPIGLIITALAALGTLLVVAYQRSDTFRAIVQAAWAGIQVAASWAWNNVLKPALDGFMVGLRAVGAVASWLWSTILSPVFGFIGTAARVLFAILATILITPAVILFRALGAIASWLWANAIGPAFRAIGAIALWLWNNGIKPAFAQLQLVFRALGVLASWLWQNAIQPAFRGIAAVASWLWNNAIKPVFSLLSTGVRALGAVGMWLWHNAIAPAFRGIGAVASWLWSNALKPVFDKGKAAVALFGAAFSLAKDAIGKAWKQVQGIAAKPVNFIIEWVYTKGIKAVWDKVAGFVGLGKLPAAPKLLAAGGTVGPGWGPASPMVTNRPTAIVGEGNPNHPEFVIPTDPKYRGRALSLWQAAGSQLMADGGIIGDIWGGIKGAASKVGSVVMSGVDFLSDPSKMWEKVTGFIRRKIAEIGSSPMAQMLAKVPSKMLGGLKDKIVKVAGSLFGGGGGGGGSWARPVSAALGTRFGVRGNMWSSGYHTGTDFPAATGTAVRAAANGVVQSALSGGPYGNHVSIAHGGGLSSLYAHLSSMGVQAGQRVLRGMRIGAVGATGNTTGPHLHFEARRGGRTINPEGYLGYAGGGRPRAGEVAWVGEQGAELVRFGPGSQVFDHETSLRMAGAGAAAAGPVPSSSRRSGLRAASSGSSSSEPRQMVLQGPLYLEGGELLGVVRGVVREAQGELVMQAQAGRRT